MRLRGGRYLLLGAAAYLVSLAATLPATHAYRWLEASLPETPDVAVSGLAGTVWDGSAQRLAVAGRSLGETHWQWRPRALVTGALGVGWSVRDGEDHVTGEAAVAWDGTVRLRDVEGRLAAGRLVQELARGLPVAAAGTVSVALERLVLEGGIPINASGRLVWNGARLTAPQPFDLGDLAVELEPLEQGGVRGTLSDGGGPLAAEGELRLEPDGGYRFEGRLAARDGAGSTLGQALSMLGLEHPRGGVRVTYQGRL